MRVTFIRRFSAAHRIQSDEGKCHRIHGHNYKAEIVVEANALGANNFLVPADLVKAVVDERYDHKLILDISDILAVAVEDVARDEDPQLHLKGTWIEYTSGPPSTENLAQTIARDVAKATQVYLKETLGIFPAVMVDVFLEETPTISAHGHVDYPSGRADN